jgi:hypothetical protein
VRRDVGSFGSLQVNNFFLFVVLMMYGASQSGVEPKSSYPFLLLLMIVMLFPLSSDPLDKVPATRRALWPLSVRQRLQLRLASIALSPVLWIAIGILLFRRVRPGIAAAFLTALIAVQILAIAARAAMARVGGGSFLKLVPGFFGPMIVNHIRQIFQILDVYIALILFVSASAYRLLARDAEPEAFPILAMMIALAISTYAQCLFGLDSRTRYQLYPLRGWRILLSKDLAFLGVTAILVLPLDPLAGLTFALIALAVGHRASVLEQLKIRRWRFTGGRAYLSVIQCVGGFVLGISAHRVSAAFGLAALVAWMISVVAYGWVWDRHRGQ